MTSIISTTEVSISAWDRLSTIGKRAVIAISVFFALSLVSCVCLSFCFGSSVVVGCLVTLSLLSVTGIARLMCRVRGDD